MTKIVVFLMFMVVLAFGAVAPAQACIFAVPQQVHPQQVHRDGCGGTNPGPIPISTTINLGTLQIGNGGTTGSIIGDVIDNGSLVFNRSDDVTFNGIVSGSGSLEQAGKGTLTLTGANGYSGGTQVSAGSLYVDGDQSTATGAITVASGATLGGKGILGGNVTVADGATLAPGSNGAIGTLAIHGDLGLSAGTMLDYTFGQANTAGGQFNDLINVDGNLVLDGILNVGVAPGGSFGPGVYRVFNYTGTLADNGLALGTIPSSASLVQTGVTHQVNLINTEGMVFSFWDGNAGPKRNNVINGGSGIWESGNSRTLNNWTDASGAVNAPFADRTFAVFQATPGTVTVDDGNGVVNAAGMQFASDGYLVWGDTIHLVGSAEDPAHSTIRVGDGTNASSGYRTTIHSMLDGDTTLVKADAGTLAVTDWPGPLGTPSWNNNPTCAAYNPESFPAADGLYVVWEETCGASAYEIFLRKVE